MDCRRQHVRHIVSCGVGAAVITCQYIPYRLLITASLSQMCWSHDDEFGVLDTEGKLKCQQIGVKYPNQVFFFKLKRVKTLGLWPRLARY